MKKILILNGPNLNLLGKREPHIYGSQTFDTYFETLKSMFPNILLEYIQSNHEGSLIDALHGVGFDADYLGIVLNAGGFTHTSVAICDAVSAIQTPVVEVHISNIHAREAFRHHSYVSAKAVGVIVGLGIVGYKYAIDFLIQRHA